MYIKGYTSNNTSVLRYLPTNPNIFSAKGEVIALIGVDPIADYPVDRIIKFVWDAVIEKYLSSQFGPLDSLKSALKAGEYELRNLIRGDEYLENTGVNLNLTILSIRGNSLYVARLGDQQILLWRNNKYIDVGEILDNHKVVAGSSAIERDDYLIVATKAAGEKIKSQQFSLNTMDNIAEEVSEDQGYLISSMQEPLKSQLDSSINTIEPTSSEEIPKVDESINRIIDGNHDLRDNDFNDNLTGEKVPGLDKTDDSVEKEDEYDSNGEITAKKNEDDEAIEEIIEGPLRESELDGKNIVITQYTEMKVETEVTREGVEDDFIDLDKQGSEIDNNIDSHEEDDDSEEGLDDDVGDGQFHDPSVKGNNQVANKEDLAYEIPRYSDEKTTSSIDDHLSVSDRETSSVGGDIENPSDISRETVGEKILENGEVRETGANYVDNPTENLSVTSGTNIAEEKLVLPAPYVGNSKFKKFIYNLRVFFIKIGHALKKFWNWLLKISGVLGGGVGKVGEKIDNVGSKVKVSIDDKLGRKMWYKKLMARISQMQISRPRGQIKGMKIDGYRYSDQRKKRIGLIIIILLVAIVLFFGIRFIIISKNESEVHKQVDQFYQESVTLVDEAERVVRENPTLAQTNIINANSKIASAEEIVLWEKDIQIINDLKARATKVEDIIYRRVGISEDSGNFELFIDAKITFGDSANPTDMISNKNSAGNQFLFVTDRGTKSVYRLSLYDKKLTKINDEGAIVASPENIDIGIDGDVFVYDKSAGMIRSSLGEDGNYTNFVSLSPLTGSSLSEKGITDLAIFGGEDSIFYTSRNDKSIYKAPNVGNAYGFPQLFVSDSSFAQINDLFADNFIYAFSGGSDAVSRYYFSGGDDLGIAVNGVNPPIQDITCAFSFWTVNHKMYLWDEPNKRIIVLEKPNDETGLHTDSLVFIKQYVYRGNRDDVFNDVKELVTDWDENYLYVLDGLRVWKIKL